VRDLAAYIAIACFIVGVTALLWLLRPNGVI